MSTDVSEKATDGSKVRTLTCEDEPLSKGGKPVMEQSRVYSTENFFGYSVRLSQLSEEDGGGWIAFVPELPGCLTDGETPDEAYNNLKEVLPFWLQVAKEAGKKIPHPTV